MTWSANGSPGWTFRRGTGTPITVGEHRATMQVQHPGSSCRFMGGDESISVVVDRPAAPDNYWYISACIRRPNIATAEAQVRAMLRTAQLPAD